ncbi:MAG: hypothetical protein HY074_07240 [Deltaproteobacteria bacterium]|nr:hypothetical protein [Deltaproteobacteria bacterium]
MRGIIIIALLVFNQLASPGARAECPPPSGEPMDKAALASSRPPAYEPQTVIDAFTAMGFMCSAFDSRKGITCKAKAGVVPGYSEEVAIIIPAHFVPSQRAHLFTHIHGNNTVGASFDGFMQKYKFEDILADSGRNSIMIIPFSHSTTTVLNHHDLQDAKLFRMFMDSVTGTIQKAKLAQYATPAAIAISGHSGAFNPIAQILEQPCPDIPEPCYSRLVNEVHLLDATYGPYTDRFARFAAREPASRLTVRSCNGGETIAGAKALLKATRANLPPGSPAPQLLPADATDAAFAATNPAIMLTNTNHMNIAQTYLPAVLSDQGAP